MTKIPTEIPERTEGLERRLQEAEARAKTRQLTYDQMLHDTKGALTLVLFYSDQILSNANQPSLVQNFAEKIKTIGGQIAQLFGDMIFLSVCDSGEPPLDSRAISVVPEMEALIALYRAPCEAKHLTLSLELQGKIPEKISLDLGCLRRILGNLILNSIKFSESGNIRVEVSHEKGWLRVRVIDEGVGIPNECRELIFNPYERGAAGESSQRGYGLGLSVARRFARAMGGEVEVTDSVLGRGTTFLVTLPG